MEYFIGENKELFVPDKKIGQGFEGVVYLNKKSKQLRYFQNIIS